MIEINNLTGKKVNLLEEEIVDPSKVVNILLKELL